MWVKQRAWSKKLWPLSTLCPPVWTPTLLRNDRGLAASLKRSWRSWSTGGGRRLRRGSGLRKYFWTAGRSAKAQQESKFFFGKKKNKTGITDCYGQEFCRIPQVPNVQLETLGSVERHKVGNINKSVLCICVHLFLLYYKFSLHFHLCLLTRCNLQGWGWESCRPLPSLSGLFLKSLEKTLLARVWKCHTITIWKVSVEMVVLVVVLVMLLLVMDGGVSVSVRCLIICMF